MAMSDGKMTIRDVLIDTMGRFGNGDDTRENLRDVLAILSQRMPDALAFDVPEAVTTETMQTAQTFRRVITKSEQAAS